MFLLRAGTGSNSSSAQSSRKISEKLIEIVAGFANANPEELAEAAERLWSETMPLVKAKGISIESEDIQV